MPRRARLTHALPLLVACLLASAAVRANPIDSHELHIVELIASGPGNGYLTARPCEDCRLQRLALSAQTRLFLGERALARRDAWRLRGRGGIVRVDRTTGRVIDVRARH